MENPIALSFTDANGRARVLHAVSVEGREWRLHAALADGSFEHNCSNWQAVERTRTWLSTHGLVRVEPSCDGIAPLG